MKSKIEAYFKHDRSYRNGVILVQELSPNIAIKRQLNVQPESPYMTGIVHEELRRLAEISRTQFQDILQVPVTPVQVPESNTDPESESPQGEDTGTAEVTDSDPAKVAETDPPQVTETDPTKEASANTAPEKKGRRKK